jgi:hypothetical protein
MPRQRAGFDNLNQRLRRESERTLAKAYSPGGGAGGRGGRGGGGLGLGLGG